MLQPARGPATRDEDVAVLKQRGSVKTTGSGKRSSRDQRIRCRVIHKRSLDSRVAEPVAAGHQDAAVGEWGGRVDLPATNKLLVAVGVVASVGVGVGVATAGDGVGVGVVAGDGDAVGAGACFVGATVGTVVAAHAPRTMAAVNASQGSWRVFMIECML